MALITVLGLTAGTLTTLSAIPQLVKTWKTRKTRDLSLGTYIILASGMFLWIIYGFLIYSIPVIAANTVSLIIILIILGFKIKYK